jgi:prepilin-type N-terminal cleavage/methylation domain-containing protein
MIIFDKTIKKAFTLAEVLITLGIIGVVAAMTIPTLMQDTQNKQTITAVKKTYSELIDAKKLIEIDNGDIQNWIPATGSTGDNDLTNLFANKMKVIKNCTESGVTGCVGNNYKYLNGDAYPYLGSNAQAVIVLADGTSMIFTTFGSSGNSSYGAAGTDMGTAFGDVYVDINGPKQPNTIGKDVFSYFITRNGIVPYGSNSITADGFSINQCRANSSGHGCGAWVLYRENMDYLQCKTGSEPVCSTIHW